MAKIKAEIDSVPNVQTETGGMQEILARLNRLEEENAELKKSTFKVADRKKIYEGPRKYSYKMINGVPIVDLKTTENSVRKNYRTGDYDIDQSVELTFADGTKKEFEYVEFVQSYTSSEKEFPKEIISRDGKNYYRFEKDGVTFDVSQSIIN